MRNILSIALLMCLIISCSVHSNRFNTGGYNFDPNPDLSNIEYSENHGESIQDAIIISKAKNSNEGIAAEYEFLTTKYGDRGIDWDLIEQQSFSVENKQYDMIVIQILNIEGRKNIYFDITLFYGKM